MLLLLLQPSDLLLTLLHLHKGEGGGEDREQMFGEVEGQRYLIKKLKSNFEEMKVEINFMHNRKERAHEHVGPSHPFPKEQLSATLQHHTTVLQTLKNLRLPNQLHHTSVPFVVFHYFQFTLKLCLVTM